NPALAIEIERIKDERFTLRVKHPAEWFFRAAAAINIENIGNIKLSRTHQLANVPVGNELLLRVFETAFLITVDGRKLFNLHFERGGPDQYPLAFGPQACQFGSNILIRLVRVLQLAVQSVALLRELLQFPSGLAVGRQEFIRVLFCLT